MTEIQELHQTDQLDAAWRDFSLFWEQEQNSFRFKRIIGKENQKYCEVIALRSFLNGKGMLKGIQT